VVPQVEDLREAGPRELRLLPGAIVLLPLHQPVNALTDDDGISAAGGHEARDGPGSL